MFGNDQFTTVLLHLDGTNGSTTFTDNCAGATPHSFTATGTTAISTTQAKFGTASLGPSTTNGNNGTNYISCANTTDVDFGSGNFTVDFLVRYNSTGDDSGTGIGHIAKWPAAGNRCFAINHLSGNYQFVWTTDGSTLKTATFSSAISTGAWNHVAVVRNGTSLLIYVNGTALTNTGTSIGTDTIFAGSGAFSVGNQATGGWSSLNGWIDEVRVSKGIARWTANFTPQNEPYDVPSWIRTTEPEQAVLKRWREERVPL